MDMRLWMEIIVALRIPFHSAVTVTLHLENGRSWIRATRKKTLMLQNRERESEKKPSRTTNTNTKPFDGFNFQFKIANSIAFYQELPLNTGNTLWQMVNFYYIWIKTQCQFYYTLSVSHCQCSTIYSSLFPLPFSSAAFYLYIVALSLSLLPARLFSIVSFFIRVFICSMPWRFYAIGLKVVCTSSFPLNNLHNI